MPSNLENTATNSAKPLLIRPAAREQQKVASVYATNVPTAIGMLLGETVTGKNVCPTDLTDHVPRIITCMDRP